MWRIPTRRDVEIPKKWNLPKAQWHTQDILQTPSCPFPGILQGHFFINTLHGLVQGGFLTCSAQSSELKRKTLLNQGGSFVHREFHGTESLIGCHSFFFLVLKIGEEQLKKAPCIFDENRIYVSIYLHLICSWMSASVRGSTLAVASSRTSTRFRRSTARARQRSWRCPTDKLEPGNW